MSPEDDIAAFATEVATIVEALKALRVLPRPVRRRIAAALVVQAAERLFLN